MTSLTLPSTDSKNVGLEELAVEGGDGATPSQSLYPEDSNLTGGHKSHGFSVVEAQMYDPNELKMENFEGTTGGNTTLKHRGAIDKARLVKFMRYVGSRVE